MFSSERINFSGRRYETSYFVTVHGDHETSSGPTHRGGIVLILTSIVHERATVFQYELLGLVFPLAALGFFLWYSSRLKFVSLDDNDLHVSGLFKGGSVPISQVEKIHYSSAIGLVLVRLKAPSTFGQTIAFMPTFKDGLFLMLGSRSIVEELSDLAKKASSQPKSAI